MSHRLLMFAALAEGTSEIRNLSGGADVAATLKILQQLGAPIENCGNALRITGRGLDGLSLSDEILNCGNSGTTLRLMLGILAGGRVSCTLHGDASLNRRPVMRVLTPLRLMGADLDTADDSDHPPVILHGKPLHGITYLSPVASAQVKSAVLLAALYAEGETEYHEPTQSRDHTELFLEYQGIDIKSAQNSIKIRPPASLRPFEYDIPGDISTAMYFIVTAALAHDSELVVENVLLNQTRTGALDVLQKMGANIAIENLRTYCNEAVGDIHVVSSAFHGIDASGFETARIIDEVPILAVAAAFAGGTTTFSNLNELRLKESDRLNGITELLQSYGCAAQVEDNSLVIHGGIGARMKTPDHYGDHRLAMAIEIMELLSFGAVNGNYQECIAISAPEFYHTLQAIMA